MAKIVWVVSWMVVGVLGWCGGMSHARSTKSGLFVDHYYEIQVRPPDRTSWLSYDSTPNPLRGNKVFVTEAEAWAASLTEFPPSSSWETRIAPYIVIRDLRERD